MSTSTNPTIQKLMDEVEALDPSDSNLEAKLQLIAHKVAEEQRKMQVSLTRAGSHLVPAWQEADLVDPADEFACEGCQ